MILKEGTVWNGPVGRCTVCGRTFGYTESSDWGRYVSHHRTYSPKDKCEEHGGKYEYLTIESKPPTIAEAFRD